MKVTLAAAALLLAAACSDASGPADDARVRTDASVYMIPGGGPAPSEVRVGFTVRNTGSEPIALPNCGINVATEVERREAGVWVRVSSSACPTLAIYAPVVLAPGEVAGGFIAVNGAGQYRLRVPLSPEVGKEFSDFALSPDFEVRWLAD
jgi:archaellum component FlaG (FlaF/FlaG flagellin family)